MHRPLAQHLVITVSKAIWYYDLSNLKIAKKKPLTLEHFADFLKRLPDRSDSDASWTVDMVARKRKAAAEARPFHEQAREKKQEAARWKERLDELRKPKLVERDDAAIEEADNKLKGLTKEANALAAKAADIENAVYDLKAVNPNRTSDTDTRTPEELLAIIEAKGREIEAALALLRNPMTVGC